MSEKHTLKLMSHFIQLEQDCRQARTVDELGYIIVNRFVKIMPYIQAFFWKLNATTGSIKIIAASSVAHIDDDAPLIIGLKKFIKTNLIIQTQVMMTDFEQQDDNTQKFWDDAFPHHLLHCPITEQDNHVVHGILFCHDTEWKQEQLAMISLMSNMLRHCLITLEPVKKKKIHHLRDKVSKKSVAIAGGIIFGLMFIPVPLTIVASADIQPLNPEVITATLNSTIETIDVEPNQHVEQNQLLLSMDATELNTEVTIAKQQLLASAEKLRKTHQASFSDDDAKTDLAILKVDINKAKAELAFNKQLLKRTKVYAPSSGVAVYSDKTDWLGKPVKIGEKVMLLANPDNKKLVIKVPVADLITIAPGAPVKFFDNINPMKVYRGQVVYSSYNAVESEDGSLVYIVESTLQDKQIPNFGTRGSAKIYGEHVSLFYYLFRRPIYFVRHLLGV